LFYLNPNAANRSRFSDIRSRELRLQSAKHRFEADLALSVSSRATLPLVTIACDRLSRSPADVLRY